VRELKNAVHRSYVLSDPPAIRPRRGGGPHGLGAAEAGPAAGDEESWPAVPVRVGETLQAIERKVLSDPTAVKGDKRVAAELLGVSLKTIYNKLKEYRRRPQRGGFQSPLLKTVHARTYGFQEHESRGRSVMVSGVSLARLVRDLTMRKLRIASSIW
jgi:hypothetical protein